MSTDALRFESLGDVLHHAERIAAGSGETTGNWSAPQIIDHVRRAITCSRTGFGDVRVPALLRLGARMMRGRFLSRTMPTGVKFPPSARSVFEPPADITMDEAMALLRDEVRQSSTPGTMTQPSPIFGRMTHEQWVKLHCRHAEMHFGFADAGAAPAG
ncbi:MAG: DUF1569 domain-containing protein [Planctomycetota bacterium]